MLRAVNRVLVVAVAAFVALASGSTTAAPTTPEARVSYNLHAQFDSEYEVDWVETTGDRLSECSYWTDDRGTNHVTAGSVVWIPGLITISRTTFDLVATGARPLANGKVPVNAEVDVRRRLVQRGGTTEGCAVPPPPFRVPTNDCGAITYKTNAATLRAEPVVDVRPPIALSRLLSAPERGRRASAIRATVAPKHYPLYRKCHTSRAAPEFPNGFPIGLRDRDVVALRTLQEGERYRFGKSYSGHCTDDLPTTSSCYYTLDIEVTIRRWEPGTRFP